MDWTRMRSAWQWTIQDEDTPEFRACWQTLTTRRSGASTNVRNANGIEPAPERAKHIRWSSLPTARWRIVAASDFSSVGRY